MAALEKRQLIGWLIAEMRRAGGRDYRINLEALDVQDLRALQRFVADVVHEQQMAVNRARLQPWRQS